MSFLGWKCARTSRDQCLESREAIVNLGVWSWAIVELEFSVSGLSFEIFCLYYRLGKRMATVGKQ